MSSVFYELKHVLTTVSSIMNEVPLKSIDDNDKILSLCKKSILNIITGLGFMIEWAEN